MDRTALVSLLQKDKFTSDDLRLLDELVVKYPWFGTGRFLRLKAMRDLDEPSFDNELKHSVIFTGDRKRLQQWLFSETEVGLSGQMFGGSELEFIDGEEDENEQEQQNDDIEAALGSDDKSDADKTVIKEKDETEMEEPEIDPSTVLPVIDSLEDNMEEDDAEIVDREGQKNSELIVPEELHETKDVEDDRSLESDSSEIELSDPQEEEDQKKIGTENLSQKLIHEFLQNNPGVIKADKETSIEGDISEKSVKEYDSNVSDTLAKIYVKQGLHAKAIYAYERLSLKYPEKSAYFAAQIEKIKSISNL